MIATGFFENVCIFVKCQDFKVKAFVVLQHSNENNHTEGGKALFALHVAELDESMQSIRSSYP